MIGHDPEAVPSTRRFIRAQLSDEDPNLVADAELVAAELVTNALLHGEAPFEIRVRRGPTVRIEVEDHGRTAPILLQRNVDAMTGRGLSLVAAVSTNWGVDSSGPAAKVVWAEIGGARRPAPSRPQVDIDELLAAWSEDPDEDLVTVALGSVSTELLLAAKAHLDNVARELTLLRDGRPGAPIPPEIAELIRSATIDFADARAQIKRQAAAAAAAGQLVTDLTLTLPAKVASAGQRYLSALDEADRWARSAHLLTLAPPPVHRLFRQWYVTAVVDRLSAAAAGSPPPPVRPFSMTLADKVSELSAEAEASSRLTLLQAVTRELSGATTAEEMAELVVDHAVRFLGVRTARVRLFIDGALRSVAWRAADAAFDIGDAPAIPRALPVDSEMPGATAFRTGERQYLRSVSAALAPYDEAIAALYPDDRSGHLVPLKAGGGKLGVMSLTFMAGALTSDTEVAIVEALADVLAQALRRAELATHEEEQRETLAFLAEATQIMVTAREPQEVLERLVTLAVPRLADWCTVYVADGDVLRRVAAAVHDRPEMSRYRNSPLPLDVDSPPTVSFKNQEIVTVHAGAGRILESIYPGLDFTSLGGDSDRASGLCVPIVLRARCLGVIGITFLQSGRRVDDRVIDTISGLAARAAIALDNAESWSAQRRMVKTLVGALLPSEPPVVEGLEFVARYLPAEGDVAGDWWEAERMNDGTVLIGLGDAAGHGVEAVSHMSELRHGARALAAVETSPSAVLSDLDRRLAGADSAIATAVYGRLDPRNGKLCWASAGHLPPLLIRPDGSSELLWASGATPLGAPVSGPPRDEELVLARGESLLLYSDGIVETRSTGLDRGMESLRETIAAAPGAEPGALADAIIRAHCLERFDDCCLLLVRRV